MSAPTTAHGNLPGILMVVFLWGGVPSRNQCAPITRPLHRKAQLSGKFTSASGRGRASLVGVEIPAGLTERPLRREHGARTSEPSADSRTGALSLHEKVGMEVCSTWVNLAAALR